jgi:hypothetical protein
MAIVDCHSEMSAYHEDEVVLSKDEQDAMRTRRDAGRTRLKAGLDKDKKPQPYALVTQGSYAMRTMVQDAELDYDIDDGIYFKKADLINASPRQAKEMVQRALKQDERLKLDAEVRDNCVRQRYPEGYHIDMPVYRDRATGEPPTELAAKEMWTPADGKAVTEWFNSKVGILNAGQKDGSQLRRIVRMTKKYARSRSDWKSKGTSGICITKLVVDHFVASQDRDDEALVNVWEAMHKKLKTSLRVDHPVVPGTTLSKGDNDPAVSFLRDRLGDALSTLTPVRNLSTPKSEALACWDKVFNTSYFGNRGKGGSGSGGKGGPPFVKTSEKVTSRQDGDRRFG